MCARNPTQPEPVKRNPVRVIGGIEPTDLYSKVVDQRLRLGRCSFGNLGVQLSAAQCNCQRIYVSTCHIGTHPGSFDQ